MEVKDSIITKEKEYHNKYYQLSRELNLKLKIPRLHLEFLHSKGSLDHFVKAKLEGNEVEAKWTLLKTGKKEIRDIEDEAAREKEKMNKLLQKAHMLKMYG